MCIRDRLTGEYGLADVCLSLPCVVGRAGVLRRIPVNLAPDEIAALRASADAVRAMDERALRAVSYTHLDVYKRQI